MATRLPFVVIAIVVVQIGLRDGCGSVMPADRRKRGELVIDWLRESEVLVAPDPVP